jgi:hypothetical protein
MKMNLILHILLSFKRVSLCSSPLPYYQVQGLIANCHELSQLRHVVRAGLCPRRPAQSVALKTMHCVIL